MLCDEIDMFLGIDQESQNENNAKEITTMKTWFIKTWSFFLKKRKKRRKPENVMQYLNDPISLTHISLTDEYSHPT